MALKPRLPLQLKPLKARKLLKTGQLKKTLKMLPKLRKPLLRKTSQKRLLQKVKLLREAEVKDVTAEAEVVVMANIAAEVSEEVVAADRTSSKTKMALLKRPARDPRPEAEETAEAEATAEAVEMASGAEEATEEGAVPDLIQLNQWRPQVRLLQQHRSDCGG